MPGTYRCPAETGLYYLQSRYYSPDIGRFINADGQFREDFGSLSACGGAALKYASTVANKTSVSASVGEPKKVANAITGYTKHGLNQAIGRDGVGVKPSAILDAVRYPVNIVTKVDKYGRISTQYRGTNSTVVLNEMGKKVSCWAKSSKYWR